MSDRNSEDIIGALYDMVQDARSMPLAADKCILERDKGLDMLDEIIAQLPAELKQSRTIVESRNELISQARREAEGILRKANDQANELIAKEEIYKEAKKRSEELIAQTQERINQLRKAANEYMDDQYQGQKKRQSQTDAVSHGQSFRNGYSPSGVPLYAHVYPSPIPILSPGRQKKTRSRENHSSGSFK